MEKSDIIIIIILLVLFGVFGIREYGERMKAVNDEESFGYQLLIDQFNNLKADNVMFKHEIQILKADNKVLKSTIKSLDQEVIGLTATVQQLSTVDNTKKLQEVEPRRRLNSKSASAEVALLNDNAIIRSS